jgi:hypothetical protein
LLLLWVATLHPRLSIAVATALTTTIATLTTTHSVVPLTHASFHLLKDVLTMLNKLLEFVLELHHLLIHNL